MLIVSMADLSFMQTTWILFFTVCRFIAMIFLVKLLGSMGNEKRVILFLCFLALECLYASLYVFANQWERRGRNISDLFSSTL